MNDLLKASLKAFCLRKGFYILKRGHAMAPNSVKIIKRKDKFIVELGTIPNSTEMIAAGFTTGYAYPAGVTGLSEQQLILWLDAN